MNTETSSAVSAVVILDNGIRLSKQSVINESLSVHYLIYRMDNLVNGKHYIGQHVTNNPLDCYAGSGNLIRRAIAKHGISAFTKTILFDFDNAEQMDAKEAELVPLSCCYPFDKTSYNLRAGGV